MKRYFLLLVFLTAYLATNAQAVMSPYQLLPLGIPNIYYEQSTKSIISRDGTNYRFFVGELSHKIHIPASDFIPQLVSNTQSGTNDGIKLTVTSTAGGYYLASVPLPQSAKIIQIDMLARDASATNNMVVELQSFNNSLTTPLTIASVSTSGSAGVDVFTNNSITNPALTYGRFLKMHFSPDPDPNMSLIEIVLTYLP